MLNHRNEIDGLRAIAVLSVILYHARFDFYDTIIFSNGFLGVDIFFVISGFLITRITVNKIIDNSFSIKNFYLHRIRRIFPMFYLVFFVCTPCAWYILLPDDFVRYQESLLTSVFFISNIFFQNISLEYGAKDSLLNPLTHTWSLSIEEQFYIIFPISILLLLKFNIRYVLIFISIVIFTSLFWAEHMSYHAPTSAFFQLGTRIWELLFGCLIAVLHHMSRNPISKHIQIFSYLFGMLLLICSANLTFKHGHPGLITIYPVVGTALIILGSSSLTKWHYPLTNKAFNYIGKISFSLYLWHYPIFSFYRNFDHSITNLEKYFLIILVFVLSVLSFHFFEEPMRRKVNFQRFIWVMLGLSVPTISVAIYTVIHPNFEQQWRQLGPERLTAHYKLIEDIYVKSVPNVSQCVFKLDISNEYYDENDLLECREKFGVPTIIIGDSHAENIFNAMSHSTAFDFILSFAQGGCRPTDCAEGILDQYIFFEKLLSKGQAITDANVIYHQSGSHFISDQYGIFDSQLAFDEFKYHISEEKIQTVKSYLENLATLNLRQVIWLGPFIEYRRNPEEIVTKSYRGNLSTEFLKTNPSSILIFKDLERILSSQKFHASNVQYIPFNQLYKVDYNARIEVSPNNFCFQFRDRDHFSHCGEKVMSKIANWSTLRFSDTN